MLRIARSLPPAPAALVVLTLVAASLLSGCSDGDDGADAASTPPSQLPAGAVGAGLDLHACALVTVEQVEEVAGFDSASPVTQTFGTVDACEYRAADPADPGVVTLAVLSGGGVGADAYDAAEQMGGEPVADLGDQAICLEVGGAGSSTRTGTVTVLVGVDVLQAVTPSCEVSSKLLEAALAGS